MDREKIEKNKKIRNILECIGVLLTAIAIIVTACTYYLDNIYSGKLNVYKPEGLCILRGYYPDGFPSDHLIIPFTLENTGNGVKSFRSPQLTLVLNGDNDNAVVYEMAGVFSSLNPSVVLEGRYTPSFSIDVPSKDTVTVNIIFHISKWWDNSDAETYCMELERRFPSDNNHPAKINAKLTYVSNEKEVSWNNGKESNYFSFNVEPGFFKMIKQRNASQYLEHCGPSIIEGQGDQTGDDRSYQYDCISF